jgi:hypothetical protein
MSRHHCEKATKYWIEIAVLEFHVSSVAIYNVQLIVPYLFCVQSFHRLQKNLTKMKKNNFLNTPIKTRVFSQKNSQLRVVYWFLWNSDQTFLSPIFCFFGEKEYGSGDGGIDNWRAICQCFTLRR